MAQGLNGVESLPRGAGPQRPAPPCSMLEEGKEVFRRASSFWRSEGGQDLVEYSLLMAAICLMGAAVFIGMGNYTSGLWFIVNSRLASANQAS